MNTPITTTYTPAERAANCACCLLASAMRDCPRCAFYSAPVKAVELRPMVRKSTRHTNGFYVSLFTADGEANIGPMDSFRKTERGAINKIAQWTNEYAALLSKRGIAVTIKEIRIVA